MSRIEPGSHLDHMLKQTRSHHMNLSTMADMKANILLTMASVVMTLALPTLSDPVLGPGVVVLMTFSLVTVLLAAYVVMPHISFSTKPGPHQDVHDKRFNILFFGSFSALSYEEYAEAMQELLEDSDATYQAQVREIYQLGIFLAKKKFRFLRWAYLSFILGFISTAIVLGVRLGLH
ncbi:DUF5706 domain-containing protein [Sulfidibacter corallicola]|uniref:Pycsar effector protein domain-containing protein n=1 Tax=Sulfidibacter corallicola TaxID=2818388 RepID=A0A8A4TQH4_SULCO|nr:Pycsar system effector family protein [Sulfidibacter corallicola]QTD51434.1 hypothetical protein J3U87_03100 [Sulfidibacter corallicola]